MGRTGLPSPLPPFGGSGPAHQTVQACPGILETNQHIGGEILAFSWYRCFFKALHSKYLPSNREISHLLDSSSAPSQGSSEYLPPPPRRWLRILPPKILEEDVSVLQVNEHPSSNSRSLFKSHQ